MNRKKKMRKLGLIPKPQKSKEQIRYEQMISAICKKVNLREKDHKQKELETNKWIEEYSNHFPKQRLDLRENWANGSTAKKSIFDPISFKNIENIDEINAKRKELNLPDLEKGSQKALEQAKEKAKRVAVVCHKSSYQYVGDNEDAKNFGKKSSQLE
jgi:hypothetical protein